MAVDTEETRWIDRIRAITFRKARDAGATFISRAWVTKYLKRSENFVKRNWNKNQHESEMETVSLQWPVVLSQESKEIIGESAGEQKKSMRKLGQQLEIKRGKKTFQNILP